jgi:hypothetical protein
MKRKPGAKQYYEMFTWGAIWGFGGWCARNPAEALTHGCRHPLMGLSRPKAVARPSV